MQRHSYRAIIRSITPFSKALGVIAISLVMLAFSPGSGNALYAELHTLLSYDAAFVRGVPGELVSFAGDPDFCMNRTGLSICNGAYDEDADRDPRLSFGLGSLYGLLGWGTHFWDPAGGPHGGRLMSISGIPINIDGQNAYERAAGLYESARTLYPQDPPAAYYLIGRAAHLLADMATPAHVHRDPHISDNDASGDDSFEEYTASLYVSPGTNEGLARLQADIPLAALSVQPAMSLPDGGYPEEPPLFRLFRSLAFSSAQYDSDDADGAMDRGGRRGRSTVYSYDHLLAAGVYGGGLEYPLSSSYYQLSAGRKKFILPMAVFDTLSQTPPVEGVRLHFTEGTEDHPLSAFSRTDMGDGGLDPVVRALLPDAVRYTASLYQLFWAHVHPSIVPAEAPEIILGQGLSRLDIVPPSPLDISLDLSSGGWKGVDTEVYIWASINDTAGTLRFYFDGKWNILSSFADLRPLAASFRLEDLHNVSWRVFDDSSGIAGMTITFAVCVDRLPDGTYSPAEAICGALPVRIH